MAAIYALLLSLLARFPLNSPETWLWLVRAFGCAWFVLMVVLHRANFGCHILGACLWIDAAYHLFLAMRAKS